MCKQKIHLWEFLLRGCDTNCIFYVFSIPRNFLFIRSINLIPGNMLSCIVYYTQRKQKIFSQKHSFPTAGKFNFVEISYFPDVGGQSVFFSSILAKCQENCRQQFYNWPASPDWHCRKLSLRLTYILFINH